MKLTVLQLMVSAFFLVQTAVFAEDWPMLSRDGTHNPVSPEKNPPLTWSIEKPFKNIKWTAKVGTNTVGTPVVSDGLVWVGTTTWGDQKDASVLACFREKDGKPLYRYVSSRIPKTEIHDYPNTSIASSPLVKGNRLWFVTNRWETICLDIVPLRKGAGEPKVIWKLDMMRELGVFPRASKFCDSQVPVCSIGGYKEYIYVITGNGVDDQGRVQAPNAPSLVCLDKKTGKVVWQDKSPGKKIRSGQWASPLVAEINGQAQVIAPQGDGWVRSFNALTGKLIWEMDTNPPEAQWKGGNNGRELWNNVIATPVLYKNRIYIANGRHDHAWYDPSLANPAWLYCIDPTKNGNISYDIIGPDGKANRNPNSGVVWRFGGTIPKSKRKPFGPRFLFSPTCYSVAIDNDLVIASESYGYVQCLDAKTGERYWKYDCEALSRGSPLIVEGKIFVATEDGFVSILNLAKKIDVVAKERDVLEPVGCSPVFANGTLYVATGGTLYAIAKEDR